MPRALRATAARRPEASPADLEADIKPKMNLDGRERRGQIKPADIETVLEVAGQLFADHGFDGVGIRLIAEKSGVSMPSIFYHFGSKAMLYEEVLEYKYQATNEMVLRAISSLDSPKEKLECLIGSFYDMLIRDQTFLLLTHRDIGDVIASKGRPDFINEYSYVFSVFAKLLEAALDRPVEARVAFSLVSLIMGFCELTALMSRSELPTWSSDNWYAEQRAELIDVGKRICSI